MDEIRNGRFSSSEIFRLMKPGKAKGSFSVDSQTYIDECNRERRLMRSIEIETDARPLTWGKCLEKRAFDLLPTEYTLQSDVTIQHPEIPDWVGSPDATTEDAVGEVKCPMTLSSFCQLVDPYYEDGKLIHEALTIEAIRANHRDGDKFFWQTLSNAVLTGKKKCRLIIYVPFLDELEEIKLMAEGIPEFYWIFYSEPEKLPYLVREGLYNNINLIEWDVMDRDVSALTARVLECGEKLIPWPEKK